MAISKKTLLKLLGDRPVAYHPMLAKALNGVIEAVFVSQLLYWYDKGKLEENWIWKTQAEWTDETGLTRSNQETARRNLKELGVLKEKRKGVPGKIHFQLDLERLAELLTMLDFNIVETQHCTMPEPSNVQCGDSANNNAETQHCIPETTTEITKDNNREGAAEKTPPEAPSHDYLTDIFNGHVNGLQSGVADPSQDEEHHKGYSNPFANVYWQVTGLHPEKREQRPAIEALSVDASPDVALWEKIVRKWLRLGWNPRNVDGMIDCYERREIPSTGKNGDSHAKNKRNNSRSEVHDPVPAATGLGPRA